MIVTWSAGVADENMAEDILVEQAGQIRRHPWWLARARLTLALLDRLGVRPPTRVLDAGCGWGVTPLLCTGLGYVPPAVFRFFRRSASRTLWTEV